MTPQKPGPLDDVRGARIGREHVELTRFAGAHPDVRGLYLDDDYAVATDGAVVAAAPLPTRGPHEDQVSKILVPIGALQEVMRDSRTPAVVRRVNGNVEVITYHPRIEAWVTVATKDRTAQFPRWEDAIPARSDRPFVVTLNPTLLAKVAEYAAVHGNVSLLFFFDPGKADATIRFECQNPYGAIVVGAIAPMRSYGEPWPEPVLARREDSHAPQTEPPEAPESGMSAMQEPQDQRSGVREETAAGSAPVEADEPGGQR